MGEVSFGVLGPLEVLRDGHAIDVGTGKQRNLLLLLLIHAGEVLPIDRLIDELWAGNPPGSASNALQVYVSGLRKALEADRGSASLLVTRRPGYVLDACREAIDARRFEDLVARGRIALAGGDAPMARNLLAEALGLWRGPAYVDVDSEDFARGEAVRLNELRLAIVEERFAAELRCGAGGAIVGELEAMVAEHPLRERLWSQLMHALYQAGRQADALRAYQRARQTLGDDLGLEPGPELRDMEASILRHAGHLAATVPPVAVRTEAEAEAPAEPEPPVPETPPPRRLPSDARRVVTVVFADLVGSTRLGEQLDGEEYKFVVNEAVTRMIAEVEDLGGTVVSIAGDGILGLFGAPAHEDDPQRAVLAGHRIVNAMAAYGTEVAASWGVDGFGCRVGVTTGLVVLGPLGGPGKVDYTALGDAVNTAARLQAAAPPGHVLVGETTWRLARGGFEWGDRQVLPLRGKSEPVAVWELVRPRPSAWRDRGVEGMEAPLIGRDRELAAALEAVDDILAGRGGVLVITGEAGIGKSRLLAELHRRVASTPAGDRRPVWFEGRSVAYGETTAYLPYQDLVRGWLGVSADQPELRVRVALQRALASLLADAGRSVQAALEAMLHLSTDPPGGQARMAPDAVPRLLADAFGRLLRAAADRGPIVVALEDLHWADEPSLQLLEALFPLTDEAAVLFVATGRPEREHAWWRVQERAHREFPHRTREVSLEALPAEADRELLAALVGPGVLPAGVANGVVAAAEGNPFFLEELLRSLMDAGALTRDGDHWHFEREVAVEIPETVERVVMARVDRLPDRCRELLADASVLGREFGLAHLERVAGIDAVPDGLRDLQRLGLLHETRRWPAPEFRFRHALIQEAVYRNLLLEHRRSLHRRAAEALEALAGDRIDEHLSALARHYDEAGDLASAAHYHQRAGDAARRLSAASAALRHYERALELGEALSWPANDRRWGELYLGRGNVRVHVGVTSPAAEDFRRAGAVARAISDPALQARVVETASDLMAVVGWPPSTWVPEIDAALRTAEKQGDEPSQVRLLGRLGVFSANGLDFATGHECATRSLALARRTGDEELVAAGLDSVKMVSCYLGDIDGLEAAAGELQELLRRRGDLWYLQWMLCEAAVVPMARSRWDDALSLLNEALAINDRISDPLQRSHFLAQVGWVHRIRGDYGAALAAGREAAASAREVRHSWWYCWTAAMLGQTYLDIRAPADAARLLTRALFAATPAAISNYLVRCAAELAWAHCLLGHEHGAREALNKATALFDTVTTPPGHAFLHASHAYVAAARAATALGDASLADSLLTPILEAASSRGWAEAEASSALVLGQVRANRALIERALSIAERADLHGVAWEALAALGHRREAAALVRQLADTIDQEDLRDRFVQAARA